MPIQAFRPERFRTYGMLMVDLFESGYLYHDTVVMAMGRFKKQDMLTFLKAVNGVSTMPIFSSTG